MQKEKKLTLSPGDYLRIVSLLYAIMMVPQVKNLSLFLISIILLMVASFVRIWFSALKENPLFGSAELLFSLFAVTTTGFLFSPFIPYLLSAFIENGKIFSRLLNLLFSAALIAVVNYSIYASKINEVLIPVNFFVLFLVILNFISSTKARKVEVSKKEEEKDIELLKLVSDFYQSLSKEANINTLFAKIFNLLSNFQITGFVVYLYNLEAFTLVKKDDSNVSTNDITGNLTFEPRNPPEVFAFEGKNFTAISKFPEIVFYLPEDELSDAFEPLLKIFCDLASLRILEVYFSQSEKQLLNRLSALYETSQKIATGVGLKQAMETTASTIKQITGMQKSLIMLVESPEEIEKAYDDPEKTVIKGRIEEHPETIWKQGFFKAGSECLLTKKPVLAHFPRYGITLLCLPIKSSDKVYGLIAGLTSLGKSEAKRDLKVMEVIGSLFGLYLSNVELVKRKEKAAVARDRDRIAKEMHDNIIQSLFSLSLIIDVTLKEIKSNPQKAEEALVSIKSKLQEIIKEIRELIISLYPHSLTRESFKESLQKVISAFTDVNIKLDEDYLPETFKPIVENTILRIIQEALSNAVRHGQAKNIEIKFSNDNGNVKLTIKDDGKGFDLTNLPYYLSSREHFGLSSIFQRTKSIGGKADIYSKPGEGTVVTVLIPLSQ